MASTAASASMAPTGPPGATDASPPPVPPARVKPPAPPPEPAPPPPQASAPPPPPQPQAPQQPAPVRLNEMPWFHGKILRDRAEELLSPGDSPDGLFLVRESTNFPGDYTLCVVYSAKVEHYRVIARNNSLTIDEEEFFENLSKLVEHYRADADGLCTRLTKARPLAGGGEGGEGGGAVYRDVHIQAFKDAGWVINEGELKVSNLATMSPNISSLAILHVLCYIFLLPSTLGLRRCVPKCFAHALLAPSCEVPRSLTLFRLLPARSLRRSARASSVT